MNDVMLWVEKYRPSKISECILTDDLKTTFQTFVDEGHIPNLLLSGGPGVGKTTVAKAVPADPLDTASFAVASPQLLPNPLCLVGVGSSVRD